MSAVSLYLVPVQAAPSILKNRGRNEFAREVFISTDTDGLFLVIDQGGHASRVAVFDRRGAELASAARPVAVHQPQPGWVEQNADELESSVREALAEVSAHLGSGFKQICAAGLATQRSNIVCWDRESGAALSPAISWQDRRAHAWMQPFENQHAQIRAITGLRPSAHYGVSKIHWCLQQLPAVQAAQQRGTLACAPLASFLLFRLLKENPVVVDAVNASRTLLWDWRQRRWSVELLNLFALADNYLPLGVVNRHHFGQLEIAGHSIPLNVCTGDQSAALFAGGKPKTGIAYMNIGTGAFLQCLSDSENPAQKNLLRSVGWDAGEHSVQVLEATVNGAGSALQSVASELGISAEGAQNQYAHWLATAKNIPLFLNGVSGLASPFWRPQFASQFVGPHASDASSAEKLVAVLESIVFLLCLNLQEMLRAGVSLHRITVSGGLCVLDGLCQRLADVSQLPVERAPQTEATLEGLAYLLVSPEQAWLNENETICFAAQNNPALSERYQRWHQELLDAVAADKVNDGQKAEP
jgi:glycerol kinase